MGDVFWKCFECEISPIDNQIRKQKLFERFLGDITCVVKDYRNKSLQKFHKNLKFTNRKLNKAQEIFFLDMAVHGDEQKKSPVNSMRSQQTLKKFNVFVTALPYSIKEI